MEKETVGEKYVMSHIKKLQNAHPLKQRTLKLVLDDNIGGGIMILIVLNVIAVLVESDPDARRPVQPAGGDDGRSLGAVRAIVNDRAPCALTLYGLNFGLCSASQIEIKRAASD